MEAVLQNIFDLASKDCLEEPAPEALHQLPFRRFESPGGTTQRSDGTGDLENKVLYLERRERQLKLCGGFTTRGLRDASTIAGCTRLEQEIEIQVCPWHISRPRARCRTRTRDP